MRRLRNYSQFLSSEEIAAITAPTPEAVSKITSWLTAHRIDSFELKGSRLAVRTSLSLAQALSQTRFHTLSHARRNQTIIRGADYWLPDAVEEVVGAVFGLHGLPIPTSAPMVTRGLAHLHRLQYLLG